MTKKEIRKQIKKAQKKIDKLNRKRDGIFDKLLKQLKIHKHHRHTDWLFDYCYNNYESVDFILEKIAPSLTDTITKKGR